MSQLEFDLTPPTIETPAPTPSRPTRHERWTSQQETLRITLQLAVPLWIAELHRMPEPLVVMERWRREAGSAVAERGDVLQYGGKKKGGAADVFNHLARGLAAAAHALGGVDFTGLHFEAHLPGWSDERAGPQERPTATLHLPDQRESPPPR